MPLPPIYDYIIGAFAVVPITLLFFASGLLYNKLCYASLLANDEDVETTPILRKRTHLMNLVIGLCIAFVFYYLITHDAFDPTLLMFVPPAAVAVICEVKNKFIPPVSLIIGGLAVGIRIMFYSLSSGFAYGLSIILSFLLAFALTFTPRFIAKKLRGDDLDLIPLLFFSLTASFFSPMYALIYVCIVYFIRLIGFFLAELIRKKRGREPYSDFPIPLQLTASFVFLFMLFI